ncbi:MAG: DNA repair protein RadA [Pseudomonadota bacterium]
MAKQGNQFVCQECGAVTAKWSGKCPSCGAWNTLVEEAARPPSPGPASRSRRRGTAIGFAPLDQKTEPPPRRLTGLSEFDRVCGGGLVAGSAILIGGDPGIGKSTLLLQVAASQSAQGKCLYVSGEEAVDQIRLRASRLGVSASAVLAASATSLEDILASLDANGRPDTLIIDSIQTLYTDALDSAPGSVAQVRTCADALIRVAKAQGICVLMVGHVTKEGAIAGPRVLEHMVDTVLYFEGDRGHQFRLLRAVKNRFGATDEVGVFEMTNGGLQPVSNPSELFLAERDDGATGTAVFAGIEGTRPILVEIQALVAPSPLGMPRRAVVGWDSSRLAMVLAVLEAKGGLAIGANDIYLNVAGGLRINEPAADLAVATALISAHVANPVPSDIVVFGEIGLSGTIRGVSQAHQRLKEAEKLGFRRALMPPIRGKARSAADKTLQPILIENLADLIGFFDNPAGEVSHMSAHANSRAARNR